jgi:hypothetical protein
MSLAEWTRTNPRRTARGGRRRSEAARCAGADCHAAAASPVPSRRRAPAGRLLLSLGSIAASAVVYAALGEHARGPVLQVVSFASFTTAVLGAPFALALAAFAIADGLRGRDR